MKKFDKYEDAYLHILTKICDRLLTIEFYLVVIILFILFK